MLWQIYGEFYWSYRMYQQWTLVELQKPGQVHGWPHTPCLLPRCWKLILWPSWRWHLDGQEGGFVGKDYSKRKQEQIIVCNRRIYNLNSGLVYKLHISNNHSGKCCCKIICTEIQITLKECNGKKYSILLSTWFWYSDSSEYEIY